MMKTILEVKDLHFHYNEIRAIKGISFHIEEGEIIALIGANGAGKTTILRCISGLLSNPASGDIIFEDKNITRMRPHSVAALGLSQVLEGRHIFPFLTVKENIIMGAFLRKDAEERKRNLEYVYDLFPVLKDRENQLGGTLSGGEQQMLAIARALMSNPRLLMMDEPSLGLAPLLVKEIFKVIRRINEHNVSVLLVEQNSKAALTISNRGYVLETGQIVISGDSDKLIENPDIKKSYLGG